jgi:WD40 repeat protein
MREGRHAYIGCNDGLIRMWDLENGKEIARFKDHRGCIYDVCLSQDEKLLASGGVDQVVRIWDASSGELVTRCSGHTGEIHEVAFAPSGLWVASGAGDGTLRVWKVHGGEELRRFRHADGQAPPDVGALAISPDGKWLVSGGPQKAIRVWDVEADGQAGAFKVHQQTAKQDKDGRWYYRCVGYCGIQFHSSGEQVLSAGSADRTVRIWNRTDGKEIYRLEIRCDPWRFSVSEDGRRFLLADWDGVIHLWAIPRFGGELRAER